MLAIVAVQRVCLGAAELAIPIAHKTVIAAFGARLARGRRRSLLELQDLEPPGLVIFGIVRIKPIAIIAAKKHHRDFFWARRINRYGHMAQSAEKLPLQMSWQDQAREFGQNQFIIAHGTSSLNAL